MATAYKHVGRVIKTKKKCAVAYRVVPEIQSIV